MDDATWAQINGQYPMPPGTPDERGGTAHAAGIDMSLIEDSLRLTPEQRSSELQQVLGFLEEVRNANPCQGAE